MTGIGSSVKSCLFRVQVEPIDLRCCDVDGQHVRMQLMQKLHHLQKLSKSNETPFIAEQVTSAVAGCALWSDWRSSVTKPAWANRRRNCLQRELFSVCDNVVLLCGITDHTQAKAAEKLLADCLAIVCPQLTANRKEPEGFRHSVNCMGCVHWMPIRYTGDATVFDNVRSLVDAAPKPKKKPAHCADLGHRFDHRRHPIWKQFALIAAHVYDICSTCTVSTSRIRVLLLMHDVARARIIHECFFWRLFPFFVQLFLTVYIKALE